MKKTKLVLFELFFNLPICFAVFVLLFHQLTTSTMMKIPHHMRIACTKGRKTRQKKEPSAMPILLPWSKRVRSERMKTRICIDESTVIAMMNAKGPCSVHVCVCVSECLLPALLEQQNPMNRLCIPEDKNFMAVDRFSRTQFIRTTYTHSKI